MPAASAQAQTNAHIETVQKALDQRPGVKLLTTQQYFCDDSTCGMTKDGTIFYRDDNHLNIRDSELVGQRLVEDNSALFR
jgi:hypothetical protein